MLVGVPKETKDREFRVGVVPDGVRALIAAGHEVWAEHDTGVGSGFSDDDYRAAGARVVDTTQAWSDAELIVKPGASEGPDYGPSVEAPEDRARLGAEAEIALLAADDDEAAAQ